MKKEFGKKQQIVIFVCIIAIIILVDQLVKLYAQQNLMNARPSHQSLIPGFISMTYVENTGAGMGILKDHTWLLALMSAVMAVVVLVLLIRYWEVKSWLYKLSLCFVSGGAIGNLIDRVFRGYVIDMFDFDFVVLAIFNVADVFIIVGAVMLVVYVFKAWGSEKKNKAEGKGEDEAAR